MIILFKKLIRFSDHKQTVVVNRSIFLPDQNEFYMVYVEFKKVKKITMIVFQIRLPIIGEKSFLKFIYLLSLYQNSSLISYCLKFSLKM